MWVFIAAVVVLGYAYSIVPKTEQPKLKPGEVEMPTSSEGKSVPILFGTRDIKSPDVPWQGDVKAVAIKKEGGKK